METKQEVPPAWSQPVDNEASNATQVCARCHCICVLDVLKEDVEQFCPELAWNAHCLHYLNVVQVVNLH